MSFFFFFLFFLFLFLFFFFFFIFYFPSQFISFLQFFPLLNTSITVPFNQSSDPSFCGALLCGSLSPPLFPASTSRASKISLSRSHRYKHNWITITCHEGWPHGSANSHGGSRNRATVTTWLQNFELEWYRFPSWYPGKSLSTSSDTECGPLVTASLRTADVSPRSLPLRDVSRPTAAMSEEKRLPFAGYVTAGWS